MIPVFVALQQLGGTGTVDEIKNVIIKNEGLSQDIINQPSSSKTAKTKLVYNIGWARSYLKKYEIAVDAPKNTSKLHKNYLNADVKTIEDIIKNKKTK